jgi:hypothetical protein
VRLSRAVAVRGDWSQDVVDRQHVVGQELIRIVHQLGRIPAHHPTIEVGRHVMDAEDPSGSTTMPYAIAAAVKNTRDGTT